jgi:hypothetical protein
MNGNFVDTDEINDLDTGMKKLKENIALRNTMASAMYWNMVNDDCSLIANKCMILGADFEVIRLLLSGGVGT